MAKTIPKSWVQQDCYPQPGLDGLQATHAGPLGSCAGCQKRRFRAQWRFDTNVGQTRASTGRSSIAPDKLGEVSRVARGPRAKPRPARRHSAGSPVAGGGTDP